MSEFTHTLDVECPIEAAYGQWTQFETFPEFMSGVRSVRQLDDAHLLWDVEIAGVEREFEAAIVEQRPYERIAWTTTDGPYHAGVVTFQPVDQGRTRVTLDMDYAPEGAVEKAGSALGVVGHRVKSDLEHFKDFIENRYTPTGSWRGTIEGGDTLG